VEICLSAIAQPVTPPENVFSLSANAQTLSSAIDMHAHSDPDGVPRKIDAVDLARLAKVMGFRRPLGEDDAV
jgi:hypothetical protein